MFYKLMAIKRSETYWKARTTIAEALRSLADKFSAPAPVGTVEERDGCVYIDGQLAGMVMPKPEDCI